MLTLISILFIILALYLFVTGIFYKKWEIYYYSTPLNFSGKILKEILGETGMKYYTIFSSFLFFIISIIFFYFGLDSSNQVEIDNYLSKFKPKSMREEAKEKAIREGKTRFTYTTGSITVTEILEEESNISELSIDEMIIIKSREIDLNICSEIKQITKNPFEEIEIINNKQTNQIQVNLIQTSIPNDTIKNEVVDYLMKNNFKETIKDNWSNYDLNIYFIKKESESKIIISKL